MCPFIYVYLKLSTDNDLHSIALLHLCTHFFQVKDGHFGMTETTLDTNREEYCECVCCTVSGHQRSLYTSALTGTVCPGPPLCMNGILSELVRKLPPLQSHCIGLSLPGQGNTGGIVMYLLTDQSHSSEGSQHGSTSPLIK